MIILLISLYILSLGFCGYMIIRNEQVFKERRKVHHKIFEKNSKGNYIHSKNIISLCDEQERIATYDQVMYRIWRRPSSFYKQFLKDLEKQKKVKL